MDWKKIVGSIAPGIATALGGPLAGTAVRELGKKLLGKDNATEEEVATAVTGMAAADYVKLKEIDAQFAKDMAAAGIKLEEIDAGDRASARARQIAMKDHTPTVMGFLLLVGYLGAQAFMLFRTLPAGNESIVMRSLGILETLTVMVVAYYFGSSRGSRAKDEIINKGQGK